MTTALFAQMDRFHRWYDSLPGTPRFLVFLSLMMAAIFPLELGMKFGYPRVALFGFLMLMGMTLLGAHRAYRLKKTHALVAIGMICAIGVVGMGYLAAS